jgi:hypothetical protein
MIFNLKNKKIGLVLISILFLVNFSSNSQSKKTLVDFFLPIKPQSALVSDGIWGAPNVLPRDINNGLEDATLTKGAYWDGKIIKDDTGKYHMYASRWNHTFSHSKGWRFGSKAIHSVSNNILGPYKDTGLITSNYLNGKAHNTVALRTKEGKYALVISERTRGEIFIADKPEGPFKLLGEIKIDNNGFDPELARYGTDNKGAVKGNVLGHMSNVVIFLRPDGKYMLVPRSGAILISTDNILGPYKIVADKAYKDSPELPQTKMEDPSIWFSGGMYHMIVNHHPTSVTYHLTSEDGIHHWKNRGIAFHKEAGIFKYTNGVENKWTVIQRATVYVENGHPTHFHFSVIDLGKGQDKPNDNHSSKIVIVPFDGIGFDCYMKKSIRVEK